MNKIIIIVAREQIEEVAHTHEISNEGKNPISFSRSSFCEWMVGWTWKEHIVLHCVSDPWCLFPSFSKMLPYFNKSPKKAIKKELLVLCLFWTFHCISLGRCRSRSSSRLAVKINI